MFPSLSMPFLSKKSERSSSQNKEIHLISIFYGVPSGLVDLKLFGIENYIEVLLLMENPCISNSENFSFA